MGKKADMVFFIQTILVAFAIFGTARLGYLFATEQQATAVLIWPPAGIGLAAVLIFGKRIWPAISLGALGAYISLGEPLAFALPATAGNTIEPLLGAYVLSKLGGFSNTLCRVKHTLGLLVGAAFFCTISSALIGATALSTSGIQPWDQWGSTLVTWWFGDAMGIVVVSPLLLVWSSLPTQLYPSKRIFEAVALASLLVVANWLVFGGLGIFAGYTYPLAFLGVPLIIWAAVRFGQYGASAASAITVFIAVLSTAHGTGPFVNPEFYISLVLVWLFSVVIASTALVLGATVTERIQAESSLQQSSDSLGKAQEIAHLGSWEWDIDSGEITWSDEACRIFGHPPGFQPTYEIFLKAVHPDDYDLVAGQFDRAVAETAPVSIEHKIIRPDNTERFVHEKAEVYCSVDGLPERLVGTVLDITDRKWAELAHQKSEDRYRILVNTMGEALIATINDSNGELCFSFTNPAAEKLFGVEPGGLIGRLTSDFIDPTHAGKLQEEIEIRRSGGTSTYDLNIRRPGGEIRNLLVTSSPRYDDEDQVFGSFSVCTDITGRKASELALKHSEEKLHALSDASFESIFLSDKGICIGQNLTAEKMFGYTPEEAVGRSGTDWIVPEDRETVFNNMMAGFEGAYEVLALRKDGTTFPCEIQARTITYKGVGTRCTALRDITVRKQLEEQLLQSQKLEAVGTLAGGIAHDFNNILFAISGNSELAKGMLDGNNGAVACLAEISTACKRAASLVKQLLSFSRPSQGSQELIRVASVIQETMKLVRATFPTTIKIDLQLLAPELGVVADSTHLHQVILNLCTNAGLAMADGGGLLGVELAEIGAGSDLLELHRDLDSDTYAAITITDTGCGIEPETLERIFEPFFTTREVGQGSGMGLAVVHGLVTTMGGKITVESTVGKGTAFQVFLPAERAELPTHAESPGEINIPGGNENILVVDDEKALAKLLDSTLTRLGYSVTPKSSSTEALELFRGNPDSFDLVLTDQTMPDITGAELARLLKKEKPDIPVILLTGHSKFRLPEQAEQTGISAYMLKPIDMPLLARTIRGLLDKQPVERQVD